MEPLNHADANRRIYQQLSELVIGHDNAKKVLINLINRSKLRYYQKWGMLQGDTDLIKLSNCLLVGNSGTGKTHLVESLSKIMKFPLLKIDATDLNPTGASGGIKSEDLYKRISRCAKDAMEEDPETYWSYEGTLDQVVVFVDEVDKLGQKLSTDWNQHVQSNFLAIFDIAQSVIRFGLIPEFVGRLNNIVMLDELTKEDYITILVKTVLPKASSTLQFYGVKDFILTHPEIVLLAEDAFKSGLGVRSLETGVSKLMVEYEFNPESYEYKV